MVVDAVDVVDVASCLGCMLEGFPQTYLGMPLSCDKLSMEAFVPLIAKADRYLARWCALLLSPVGRLVLVNTVLYSLPTYAMSAPRLPPTSQGP
jgi:hypothetical protein